MFLLLASRTTSSRHESFFKRRRPRTARAPTVHAQSNFPTPQSTHTGRERERERRKETFITIYDPPHPNPISRVPPEEVDEEDDDDAGDVHEGVPKPERRDQLPKGLEHGLRDGPGQADDGIQQRGEVGEPRREDPDQHGDVEDL